MNRERSSPGEIPSGTPQGLAGCRGVQTEMRCDLSQTVAVDLVRNADGLVSVAIIGRDLAEDAVEPRPNRRLALSRQRPVLL